MSDKSEAILAYWSEQRTQLRPSESQRSSMTNYLLVIAAGLSGLIAQQKYATTTIPHAGRERPPHPGRGARDLVGTGAHGRLSAMETQGANPTGQESGTGFFISYHAADRKWAEWVGWELEEAGYQATLQHWDYLPGNHWTAYLQKAVTESRYTIALLSEAFIEKVYAQPGWENAYIQDPDGFKRKLLPVRVADCRRPGLFADIGTFDLFDVADEASARDLLLRHVAHALTGRAKPASKPPFPGPRGGDRWRPGPATFADTDSLLPGEPLAALSVYPVRLENRRPRLNLELLREACRQVVDAENVRAAVDLIYLADENPHLVQASSDTYAAVQQVKREFQDRTQGLGGPQAQRRYLFEPLIDLTHGLGAMFDAVPIEFLLHDTRDPLHSVRAVAGYPITGRKRDSPATNVAWAYIIGQKGPAAEIYKAPFRGRHLKCTTIPFHHRVFGLYALLCINLDINSFLPDGLVERLQNLVAVPGDRQEEELF
ncbi:TIR domain-containing protein [Frankia sp. CiP3]|uniref:TIR domain-containing protein n=1 Tax=Frankia sp. CiP3 TaxID=2880971 RepID=UPI001EF68637|nr:TIR domain-containing protein [Frankia sp. CiP3]